MSNKCKICGGTSVDFDAATGSTVCMTCGEVLEEGRVVNELSFSQSSSGRVGLVGQRVNLSTDASRLIWGGQSADASLALATTIQRGGVRTEWIGQRLGLRNHTIEEAKRMFQLAAQRNFTAGRRTSHVSAACLYIVCRRDRAPFMLLDFADALHASVRELGQIYMKLVRLLNLDKVLDIPIIDPSLFMERFSAKLSLGSEESAVCHTAVRLIQAMSRDWICTGRRPTGLCGAALLIACRAHGAIREAAQIAEVVRIGQVTIRRRLYELQNTSTAALTFDQFQDVAHNELDESDPLSVPALPPSLIKNRAKEAKERARLALEDVCASEPNAGAISSLADSLMLAISNGDLEIATEIPDDISDDSDLEILNDEDTNAKAVLWHQWSKPWLEEWQLKQTTKRVSSKRPLESTRRLPPQATASESTRLAINKKAKTLSSRVNVDALDQLFRQNAQIPAD